ncbi:hypothetical protein SPI_07944 [Niveomyces insectorum RCEF 264]|uniref:Uncharacterized protein n=1 Tax=Niveomyces insectorum RCEF 264 TaxID=1081102 RepID=A0A167P685_9HYPO|nr:hypothetical protein SPI_07944 [Niveomyces insectorum RCEF 264]
MLAVVLALSLATRVSAQHGPYKYCCDIQKCQNITATCSQNPSCATSCLGADTAPHAATCTPSPSLPGRDYACFARYMSPNTSLIDQICGQSYSPTLPPAPDVFISYGECRTSCGGWDIATSSTSTGAVALLMQYIVPVVVFCFTIPRRRKWDVPDCMFGFGRHRLLRAPRLVVSLLLSGLIVTMDVTIWIFTTFITAGPILVGGITELVLDFEILRHMEDVVTRHNCPEKSECLTPNERVELMVAVLCGNLDDGVGEPRRRISEVLSVDGANDAPERLKATQASLAAILRSQGTFGSLVGAPVLFFLGAFVVALDGLSEHIGDNSTAHSLAFGMWWMVVVHVTVVSSCVLGSNNPSTVSGIVGDYEADDAKRLPLLERLKRFGMSPMYDSAFTPVTLWDRGRMKKRWLQHTAAWKARCWLRAKLSIRPLTGLFLIPLFAFLLVLIPTALAFMISYTTPKICLFANVAMAVGITSVSLAMSGALFAAFAGTILELLGVYGNCICSIPAGKWLSPGRDMVQLNLATDTLLHRQMSKFWSAGGYTAIGVVMTLTYLGWWYQRALRRRFEREISGLNRHRA